MSKKIVKTENRERIQAGLLAFVDNNNGTANISDVASNVSVEGTRLDEDLLNGMQEGLIFTVDSNLTAKAGYDSYELGLVGMYGTDNLNGFPLFDGFSIRVKIPATNTQDVVKVKISGTEYDLVKSFGNSTNIISAAELKQGNVYDLIYDGTRFNIYQNNILPYGTKPATVLEGSQLPTLLGVDENQIAGLISATGNKFAGNVYKDTMTNSLYLCYADNALNYVDLNYFSPISNTDLLDKTNSLLEVRETVSGPGPLGAVRFFRLGKRVTFFVFFEKVSGFTLNDNTKIADYPANFIPDDFFINSEHVVANKNNLNVIGARLVIRPDGIYAFGVTGVTHTEFKGSLNYIAK